MSYHDDRDFDEERDNAGAEARAEGQCCKGRFEVCAGCQGRGVSSAYLGAFTEDDRAEMDDDWLDDYRAGEFDQACGRCGGQRVTWRHRQGCAIRQLEQDEESEARGLAMMAGEPYL